MGKKNPLVDDAIESQIRLTELLAGEVVESAERYRRWLQQLKRTQPGTEKYFDLAVELSVESQVIRTKAEHAEEELDKLLDELEDSE